MRNLVGAIALLAMAGEAQAQEVSGAGAPFEVVTLTIEGPRASETGALNPFSDIRLDWTITQGEESWTVPGYFAACGNAADTGCTQGNVWRAHFLPPASGNYEWSVRFQQREDIAFGEYRAEALAGDRATGTFAVTGASADPVRARGLLRYTGERYYRYAGDGSVFFKFGPDAPENMLAFSGFDATPDAKGLRKDWAPHVADMTPAAEPYRWGADQNGAGLLGMIDYLAVAGANTISMLLWNTGGDDRNVFPHLLATDAATYAAMEPAEQWRDGIVQDRFDVSKLGQWQRALAFADARGMHLHFKLQETENDLFMDGGALGRTRKLYLREMVARFGHYLASTWNLGEENVQQPGDVRQMAAYVAALDPYDRPLVIHSYPHQKERYFPLIGVDSALNGFSMQGRRDDFSDLRKEAMLWSMRTELAGRPMVMSYDEPGTAGGGAGVQADYPAERLPRPREVVVEEDVFLRDALWNALTAGGNGVEAYYGYKTGCGDLDCQDHRTRDRLWREGRHAIEFFRAHVGEHALAMRPYDELTVATDDYVLAEPGERYVVVPGAEPVELKLAGIAGRFSVRWFDRARGGDLQAGSLARVEGGEVRVPVGEPPVGGSGKWVALVERLPDEAIRVEAEDFDRQHLTDVRRWCRSGECPPGWERPGTDGYVVAIPDTRVTHDDPLVEGENFSREPGKMAILSYDVDFPAAGRWYLWVRAHYIGNEDNGIHAGIDGTWPESGARVQYCNSRGRWVWSGSQRTVENHCGVPGTLWLDVDSPGRHRVEFSMREDGFVFDAFYLTRSPQPPAELMAEDRAAMATAMELAE